MDQNGQALPGANVFLQGTYDGATTDTAGVFSFSTEEVGAQTLQVEFMEYKTHLQALELEGKPIQADVLMQEAFSELKAVSITAGAFEASDKKKTVILNSLDMVTTAGSNGDVYGALQTLPGTATVGESGRLFVRGGSGRETQTFIDGTLVQNPYASTAPGTPTRGRFNPFMFKGTVFSTGGYSAEYGQALSSVLLLDTKDIPGEDQLDLSFLTVGGSVSGTKTWENGAVTADVGYTNLEPYMSLVPQNYTWNKAPRGLNSSVNLRQKTGKSGMLKLYSSFSRNRSDLEQADPNALDGMTRYQLENDNLYVNASWRTLLNEKWALRSGASFTTNPDRIGIDDERFDRLAKGAHAKTSLSHQATDKIKVRMGGEYFYKSYGESYQSEFTDFEGNYEDHRIAGFAEADIFASTKFVSRIGGRYEYSRYLNKGSFSPRLSTALKLNKNSQLSLAYGWFKQDPEERFLLYSNELDQERADHLILGYQSTQSKRTLRAEAYLKSYSQLIKFTDEPFFSPEGYNNQGKGFAYGFDLFFRDKKTIKNGDYWVSYSFIETERDQLDYPEMATPGFVSRHNLSLVYKHWIGDLRSMVGFTAAYGSPRRYHDPNQEGFQNAEIPAYKTIDLNWSYLHRENVIFHVALSNIPGFNQSFGQRFADSPNPDGSFASTTLLPPARRFFLLGCFITLSPSNSKNQLDKIQ